MGTDCEQRILMACQRPNYYFFTANDWLNTHSIFVNDRLAVRCIIVGDRDASPDGPLAAEAAQPGAVWIQHHDARLLLRQRPSVPWSALRW